LTERSHKRPGGASVETEGLEKCESFPGWMECMGEGWATYSSADQIVGPCRFLCHSSSLTGESAQARQPFSIRICAEKR